MLRKFKELLSRQHEDFAELVKQGAQVVDVRTSEEFEGGHIKGSVNIPLQEFHKKLLAIRVEKPVIVCCASGARSSTASDLLKSRGYTVFNGGGWRHLERAIDS